MLYSYIQPDNLLITDEGRVKLTDFGLSQVGLYSIVLPLIKKLLHTADPLRFSVSDKKNKHAKLHLDEAEKVEQCLFNSLFSIVDLITAKGLFSSSYFRQH